MHRYKCSNCREYFKSETETKACLFCKSPLILELASIEYEDNFGNIL